MTIAINESVEASQQSGSEKSIQKKIGIPKEILVGECRVAATPDTAKLLQKYGFEVLIETGAGNAANFCDDAYEQADCRIIFDPETLWAEADLILKVRAPDHHSDLNKHETELYLGSPKPRTCAKARRSQSNGDRNGCRASDQSSAKARCP